MALLCKNFKPESQVVWIWEAFLPLCNLVVDIVYNVRTVVQNGNRPPSECSVDFVKFW